MHKYAVYYLESAVEDIRKLDERQKKLIRRKIDVVLAVNPKEVGKPLRGQFKGYWRYRIGDYRIIYRISDEEILIVIIRIGHRKNIYE
jgi:mRNA interferase RelE/StbE